LSSTFATGTSGTIGRYLQREVTPIRVNLLNEKEIKNWFLNSKRSVIDSQLIHLAGIVGANAASRNPLLSEQINVSATVSLAENFLNNGGGRFIFVSSSHVYRWKESLISEEDPLEPQTLYAEQKLRAEVNLLELFNGHLQKLLILRVFSILDFDGKPYTLGGRVATSVRNQTPLFVENANEVRDFLTPTSVANILHDCSTHASLSGIFNICTQKATSVREAILQMISQAPQFHEKVHFVDSQTPTTIIGSNHKLLNLMPNLSSKLNWSPIFR